MDVIKTVFAETKFDCVAADGEFFVAVLRIGDAEECISNGHFDAQVSISFEPLFGLKRIRGGDSFNAICIAIALMRDALRSFTNHGGRVYFPATRSLIDIESPLFTTFNDPIADRFLSNSTKPQA